MGMSGQRHVPAALYPRGKGIPVPIVQEVGWAPEQGLDTGQKKNPPPLPGMEPRSPGRPVHSQTLY
jgi:hypothetical protein